MLYGLHIPRARESERERERAREILGGSRVKVDSSRYIFGA
jgi:hypothetical protein